MGTGIFDLTGKVALITGANSGIGFGMAQGLVGAGATVVGWGTNPEKNVRAEAQLVQYGTAVFRQVDVSHEESVVAGVAEALRDFGRLDFVVANAGFGGHTAFEETTTEQWRRITTINLDAVFWTFREGVKPMIAEARRGEPGGSLLVTSSTAAIHGPARHEAYAASKAGVTGMVRSLAVEYGKYGIRANAVLPGWIRSDLTADAQTSQKITDKVISRVPMRRWGDGADFAGLAVYLASDASRYHTGDSFVIDGGYTLF
jgi:NAD(P)-dependent dehydrogenase (short-subunit alcohol dehydrogenase family)